MWTQAAARYYVALERAHRAGFHLKGDSLHQTPHVAPEAARLWNEAYEALREYIEAVEASRRDTISTPKKRA